MNSNKVLSGALGAAAVSNMLASSDALDIVEYCEARGFAFEPELIARYIASFLTKPFVILAGVSGTGKSKLAELVAEFYSRKPADAAVLSSAGAAPIVADGSEFIFENRASTIDPTRFALVAVRPDWLDNQSVFGFVNPITQAYESTQALDLILRAQAALVSSAIAEESPRYFMLLDEMNLAKVEHYFSDWLACSESRRYQPDDSISQQAIALHRSAGDLYAMVPDGEGQEHSLSVPKSFELPINLVVTGTVNVDETTYGISPKVLDRAMVLEFDAVDLDRMRGMTEVGKGEFRLPTTLPDFELPSAEDYEDIPEETHQHLKNINSILATARLHFGYRSAAEMALFMSIYNDFLPELVAPNDDKEWMRALDIALLQKVLPRLQGNRAKLEAALVGLCAYLRDAALAKDLAITTAFDVTAPAALPKSYLRALDMLESLRDFGFVSFFK